MVTAALSMPKHMTSLRAMWRFIADNTTTRTLTKDRQENYNSISFAVLAFGYEAAAVGSTSAAPHLQDKLVKTQKVFLVRPNKGRIHAPSKIEQKVNE
jgi:hypothetical protein